MFPNVFSTRSSNFSYQIYFGKTTLFRCYEHQMIQGKNEEEWWMKSPNELHKWKYICVTNETKRRENIFRVKSGKLDFKLIQYFILFASTVLRSQSASWKKVRKFSWPTFIASFIFNFWHNRKVIYDWREILLKIEFVDFIIVLSSQKVRCKTGDKFLVLLVALAVAHLRFELLLLFGEVTHGWSREFSSIE